MNTNGTIDRRAAMFDREPPNSPEAEMALLGAMMLDFGIVAEVDQLVRADDFYSERHAAIFSAIVKSADRDHDGALLAVLENLRSADLLESIGGAAYLTKLCEETPGPAASAYFAKVVVENARRRRLIAVGSGIMHRAVNGGMEVAEQVDAAEAEVFAVADSGRDAQQAEPLMAILDREVERVESDHGGPAGLATHFVDLDRLTGGLQRGDMIVIAARPSMGKSALMLNMVEQMGLGGPPNSPRSGTRRKVALFTMEMSRQSIAQRMLSAHSGVSCTAMRSGAMSASAVESIRRAAIELSCDVYVDDTAGMSVNTLRAKARRMKAKHGIDVLFIDYLQLMTAPGSGRESRQVEVSAISRGVKSLARELNIPVVCLSQLNRGAESRHDNRPRLSDLRESGAIEQDADVVMLLHREDYYRIGQKDDAGNVAVPDNKAELIIAKQRNGPTDVVHLVWSPVSTRFLSAARW